MISAAVLGTTLLAGAVSACVALAALVRTDPGRAERMIARLRLSTESRQEVA